MGTSEFMENASRLTENNRNSWNTRRNSWNKASKFIGRHQITVSSQSRAPLVQRAQTLGRSVPFVARIGCLGSAGSLLAGRSTAPHDDRNLTQASAPFFSGLPAKIGSPFRKTPTGHHCGADPLTCAHRMLPHSLYVCFICKSGTGQLGCPGTLQ